MKILFIDNFDSFTYNLVDEFEKRGCEVLVYRNNTSMKKINSIVDKFQPKLIVISPGPSTPSKAGNSIPIITQYSGKIPIFGVCLGMQAIVEAFGGKVGRCIEIMHGKSSKIRHDNIGIFKNIPLNFQAGRYHSLEAIEVPYCLEISARSIKKDIVMAVRHKTANVFGLQFHPESILTPEGGKIIDNIIREAKSMIKEAISKLIEKKDLTTEEAYDVMFQIMSGNATDAQIAGFLVALRLKGETIGEITGFAKVMREKSISINVHGDIDIDREDINFDKETILDTCGTGGTGTNTFNISTATAFVVAGAGVKVAKHGNRAASSLCGSADVLHQLGVNLNISPEKVEKCIQDIGIGFLFAPLLHNAMKYAIGPRKELGIRTVFNILGPLTNPANANTQVLGVYDSSLTETMANVLNNLGTKKAFVVHGEDALDEITITGKTRVSELSDGIVKTYDVQPEDFGLKRASLSDIKGGDSAANAEIVLSILKGEKSAKRDIVLLNSAFALVAADKAKNIKEGIAIAENVIDSGIALDKLNKLVEWTNK